MKRNLYVSACASVVLAALPAVPVFAQPTSPDPAPARPGAEVGQPTTDPSATNSDLRVYALKYLNAEDAVSSLSGILQGPIGVQVTADPRTNALIVSAPPDQHARIREVLTLIDVPATSKPPAEPVIQSIHLKNAPASATVKVLQQLSLDVTVAVDERTNTLLLSGEPVALDVAKGIIQQLDVPQPGAQPCESCQVRVVWLVSNAELPAPPPDMKDVIDELASMGIKDLKLAAQSVVRTVSDGKFTIQATPAAFPFCTLEIQGAIQEMKSEQTHLDLTLDARGLQAPPSGPVPVPGPAKANLVSIRTAIIAPAGHKVVLGVAPIGTCTSAFVVQVLGNTPGK
jgi:hypothetical protein